jgi:hypothetical protein
MVTRSVLIGLLSDVIIVAGVIGGGVTVFFWKGTRYFVGAMGGFTFGLWIECFRDGGLIDPIGFRYIMFIGECRAKNIWRYHSCL